MKRTKQTNSTGKVVLKQIGKRKLSAKLLNALRFRGYCNLVHFSVLHVDRHFTSPAESLRLGCEADAIVRRLTLRTNGPLVNDMALNSAFLLAAEFLEAPIDLQCSDKHEQEHADDNADLQNKTCCRLAQSS